MNSPQCAQWAGRRHGYDYRRAELPSTVATGYRLAGSVLADLPKQQKPHGMSENSALGSLKEEGLLRNRQQPYIQVEPALEFDSENPESITHGSQDFMLVPSLSPSVASLHPVSQSPDPFDSDSFLRSMEASNLTESCQVMEDDFYSPLSSRRTSHTPSISLAEDCDATQECNIIPELFSPSNGFDVEPLLHLPLPNKAEKSKEDWLVGLNTSSLLKHGQYYTAKAEPDTLSPTDVVLIPKQEEEKPSLLLDIFMSESSNCSDESTTNLPSLEREASILSSFSDESSSASSFSCEKGSTTKAFKHFELSNAKSEPTDQQHPSPGGTSQSRNLARKRASQSSLRSNLSSSNSSDCDFTPKMNSVRPVVAGQHACTDCVRKFERANLLRKHRRTKHGVTTTSNTHTCSLPNPSSGRSCSIAFSRSYDLVRHQETIHAKKRSVLRCEHCDDARTFSRQDALVRHRRVKHLVHVGK